MTGQYVSVDESLDKTCSLLLELCYSLNVGVFGSNTAVKSLFLCLDAYGRWRNAGGIKAKPQITAAIAMIVIKSDFFIISRF